MLVCVSSRQRLSREEVSAADYVGDLDAVDLDVVFLCLSFFRRRSFLCRIYCYFGEGPGESYIEYVLEYEMSLMSLGVILLLDLVCVDCLRSCGIHRYSHFSEILVGERIDDLAELFHSDILRECECTLRVSFDRHADLVSSSAHLLLIGDCDEIHGDVS